MATTPNSVYYPVLSDAPNGPSQMQQLAQSVDHKIIGSFATAAARSAAITAPNDGDVTYRADAKVYEKYSSVATAWTFMPGQVVGTVNTATTATSSGTNGVTEALLAGSALTVANIESGRNYFVEFGCRFVASVNGTTALAIVHASQSAITTGSPVIYTGQQYVTLTGAVNDEQTFRFLWTPGASGSWNLELGVKSAGGTGNSQIGNGNNNAFLTVVAA